MEAEEAVLLVLLNFPPRTFPSTRNFASEPVRELGSSDENTQRDPQIMSRAFENLPTAFS